MAIPSHIQDKLAEHYLQEGKIAEYEAQKRSQQFTESIREEDLGAATTPDTLPERMLLHQLKYTKQQLGDDSIECAGILRDLGLFYIDHKQKELAIQSFTDALRIFRQKYAVQHPDIRQCEEHLSALAK